MNKIYGTVDIGGTKIMTGITDESGKIKSSEKFPTLELPVLDTIDRILLSLKKQCETLSLPFQSLSGIGVVCAGPVNVTQGTIENPYTLPGWEHYPLVDILKERSLLPIKLENDVNGALLGEILLKNLFEKRVLMIAFGTGIGCAFQAQGELYRAGNGFHPELGHIIVSNQGTPCYCGRKGCFESLWSGTALHQRAQKLGFLNFDDLYFQWENGDKNTISFMNTIKQELQTAVWNLGIIFKPDIIILGGGIMSTFFPFAKHVLSEDITTSPDFLPPYEVLQADSQYNPALIGSMRLFLN